MKQYICQGGVQDEKGWELCIGIFKVNLLFGISISRNGLYGQENKHLDGIVFTELGRWEAIIVNEDYKKTKNLNRYIAGAVCILWMLRIPFILEI